MRKISFLGLFTLYENNLHAVELDFGTLEPLGLTWIGLAKANDPLIVILEFGS